MPTTPTINRSDSPWPRGDSGHTIYRSGIVPTSITSLKSFEIKPLPIRSLRHKTSPRNESLRELRLKESEACLNRAYECQTLAYTTGRLSFRFGPKSAMSTPRTATPVSDVSSEEEKDWTVLAEEIEQSLIELAGPPQRWKIDR